MRADIEEARKKFKQSLKVLVPDPDFSPQKNHAIVEQSILDYEEYRKKKKKEFVNKTAAVNDALADFFVSTKGAYGGRNVEQYFGRETLAELRGQQIIKEVQSNNRLVI